MVEEVGAAAADAGRNLPEQGVHQPLQPRLNVLAREVGAEQADAAIDVVADAPRRDHAPFRRIGRANAADAEAVSPMDVGHGEAGHLNAGQEGDVGHLLGGLVVANLLDQAVVGEDSPFDLHPRLVVAGNPPGAFVDLLQRAGITLLRHVRVPSPFGRGIG